MQTRRSPGIPVSLWIGGLLCGLMVSIAMVSVFWTPYDPTAVDLDSTLLDTGAPGHPLGTDSFGRDQLSHVMAGAKTSLSITTVAVAWAVIVGVAIGATGGMFRGVVDDVLMRIVDVLFAFPGVLIAIMLAVSLGNSPLSVISAVALAYVPGVARLARSATMQVKERDFVLASYAYGRSRHFTFFRHILPNISSVLVVQASVLMGLGILLEASLSYIGIGPPPPTPSWGRMLSESQSFLSTHIGLALWPGVAIALSVLGFNQLGDGLRDLLDPRGEQFR